jgi:hypothetical protein
MTVNNILFIFEKEEEKEEKTVKIPQFLNANW